MKKTKRKGQTFIVSIIVILIIVALGLKLLFKDVYELINRKENYQELETHAKRISNNLMSQGYPTDWNETTVQRIGLITGHKIDSNKVFQTNQISYDRTRTILGVPNNYQAYFTKLDGEIIPIGKTCYIGEKKNSIIESYNITYFHKDSDELLSYLEGVGAEIFDDTREEEFIKSVERHQFIIIENGELDTDSYKSIESNASKYNKTIFLIEKFFDHDSDEYFSIGVKQHGGAGNREARVVNEDEIIPFEEDTFLQWNEAQHVYGIDNEEGEAKNYKEIVTWTDPHSIEDTQGVAKWKYGNSTVYFLSDIARFWKNSTNEYVGYRINSTVQNYIEDQVQIICKKENILDDSEGSIYKITNIVVAEEKGIEQQSNMIILVW